MKKTLVLALAAIMVLGVAGAAFAADYPGTLSGSQLVATNSAAPVQVTAKVPAKLTLTLDTTLVAFGSVDPDATPTSTVAVTVKSNKTWTGAVDVAGQATEIGLATSTDNGGWDGMTKYGAVGNNGFADVYSLNVPWETAPGDKTATVTYTVTQN
ncbi:MAG: hypothetical protein WBJ62_03515 [Coriobacteriia bacterium]